MNSATGIKAVVKLLGKKVGVRYMAPRLKNLLAEKGSLLDMNCDFFIVRFMDDDGYHHALYMNGHGPWVLMDHFLL